MRISDWSSDVCSSDLATFLRRLADDVEQEKDTSGGGQPTAGGATPAELTRLRAFASATERRHDGIRERQIGRASCREREWQYRSITVVHAQLHKNKKIANKLKADPSTRHNKNN